MISSANLEWDELLGEDKINLLLLSLHSQLALVQSIEETRECCEQYRDKDAVIFSRCEPIQ